MRRQDKEITEQSQLQDILRRAEVCRLALLDGDRPYIVPLNFGCDGTHLYFHGAREGKKLDLVRRNGNACFEVETDVSLRPAAVACSWSTNYRSIIGYGRVDEVSEPVEKLRAMQCIMAHYSPEKWEITAAALERIVILRLTIESMTGKQSPAPGKRA